MKIRWDGLHSVEILGTTLGPGDSIEVDDETGKEIVASTKGWKAEAGESTPRARRAASPEKEGD